MTILFWFSAMTMSFSSKKKENMVKKKHIIISQKVTMSNSQSTKIIRDKIKRNKKKKFEKNEDQICHKNNMKSNYKG